MTRDEFIEEAVLDCLSGLAVGLREHDVIDNVRSCAMQDAHEEEIRAALLRLAGRNVVEFHRRYDLVWELSKPRPGQQPLPLGRPGRMP